MLLRGMSNPHQVRPWRCDLARKQAAATSGTRPLWRRGLSLLCAMSAWIVSLSLLAVAALRILYHDGTYVLVWLNAFTRYVYLPAYLCLLFAAWQRRWRLVLVSSAVVGCHLAWLAPDFLRDRRFEPPASSVAVESADTSPTMRIFFANVRENSEEYPSMLEEITEADPDVIVLVEYGWGWHLTFKTSPVLAPYKYGSGHLQSHIGSVNVFSRLPLKTEMQSWVAGRPTHTIEVELGSQAAALDWIARAAPDELSAVQLLRVLGRDDAAAIVAVRPLGDRRRLQRNATFARVSTTHPTSSAIRTSRSWSRIRDNLAERLLSRSADSHRPGISLTRSGMRIHSRGNWPRFGSPPAGRGCPDSARFQCPCSTTFAWRPLKGVAGLSHTCRFCRTWYLFTWRCKVFRPNILRADAGLPGLYRPPPHSRLPPLGPAHFRCFESPFVEVFRKVATIKINGLSPQRWRLRTAWLNVSIRSIRMGR